MFGKGLQQQMTPAAPQAPADPMSQINAKLDQIISLLQEDKANDTTGGELNG